MAHQLWISPNTGIRRKGTTFKELQAIFIDNITTKYLYEPIYSCKLSDRCHSVREELSFRDFDIASVINEKNEIIGFVNQKELIENFIKDHTKIIEINHLISDSTPISALINILTKAHFVFVLVQDRIEGIVTRADINKPIVRIYLFGIISLLEMHLNFWITEFHQNDLWKSYLNDKRLNDSKTIYEKRKGKNDDLSLLECLQFCDKKEILCETNNFLKLFSFSKTKFERLLRHIELIRNELDHSQNSIISNLDWDEFYETVSKAEDFLHSSEEKVEEKVKASMKTPS
ncbi:MAG: CBS domain-containing protein [Saprospiraceae bacterium]|nr:CBS domain-containing protein [Saprospiraceae bacterium]